MKCIQDYLDTARARGNLSADWKLAVALGLSPQWAARIRGGLDLPSPEVMLRLADLAGVQPERALLDLNLWRAKSPSVAKVYAGIIQRLGAACIVSALLVAGSPSGHANPLGEQTITNAPKECILSKMRRYLLWAFLFLIRFAKDIHLQSGSRRIEHRSCFPTRFSDA